MCDYLASAQERVLLKWDTELPSERASVQDCVDRARVCDDRG